MLFGANYSNSVQIFQIIRNNTGQRETHPGHEATGCLPQSEASPGPTQERSGLGEVIEELGVAGALGGSAGQAEERQQTKPEDWR